MEKRGKKTKKFSRYSRNERIGRTDFLHSIQTIDVYRIAEFCRDHRIGIIKALRVPWKTLNEDIVNSYYKKPYEEMGKGSKNKERGKSKKKIKYGKKVRKKLKYLPTVLSQMRSSSIQKKLSAAVFIRELLALSNPPVNEIVKQGFLPELVKFLKRRDQPQLQFEALWAITNIAASTKQNVEAVVRCGAIPILIKLMLSRCNAKDSNGKRTPLSEQAIQALGNIISESTYLRDYVLRCKMLKSLLKIINDKHCPTTTLQISVWCLSNAFRMKPLPRNERMIGKVIYTLKNLLKRSKDFEVIADILWCISYISDEGENIKLVIHYKFVEIIVDFLHHQKLKIQTPALRTIGNIVTGTNDEVMYVINCGALKKLKKLVFHEKASIVKEAVWTISNIVASNCEIVDMVLKHKIFPRIVEVLRRDSSNTEIKKEAIYVLANSLSNSNPQQVSLFVEMGFLTALMEIMQKNLNDTSMLELALEGCAHMLDKQDMETKEVQKLFEQRGMVKLLKQIMRMRTSSKSVKMKANGLIKKHFSNSTSPEKIKSKKEQSSDREKFQKKISEIQEQVKKVSQLMEEQENSTKEVNIPFGKSNGEKIALRSNIPNVSMPKPITEIESFSSLYDSDSEEGEISPRKKEKKDETKIKEDTIEKQENVEQNSEIEQAEFSNYEVDVQMRTINMNIPVEPKAGVGNVGAGYVNTTLDLPVVSLKLSEQKTIKNEETTSTLPEEKPTVLRIDHDDSDNMELRKLM